MTITVYYDSVDGYHEHKQFTDIDEARTYAQEWIGKFPTLGRSYAISDDGVGKIMVSGTTLKDLFPNGI